VVYRPDVALCIFQHMPSLAVGIVDERVKNCDALCFFCVPVPNVK